MDNIEIIKDQDSEKIIYPFSVSISEPTKAKSEYDDYFGNSLFFVFFRIFSENPEKLYTVESSIIDIKGLVDNSFRSREFETLNSKEFRDYMTSIHLIFPNFKRYILNFEKRPYNSTEYSETIANWLDSIILE